MQILQFHPFFLSSFFLNCKNATNIYFFQNIFLNFFFYIY